MVKQVLTYSFLILSSIVFSQSIEVKQVKTKFQGGVFGPAFYRGKLMVCSNQQGKFVPTVKDENNTNTTDLYIITDTTGKYEKFEDQFQTDFNDGPATFDADGGFMIISRNIDVTSKLASYQLRGNNLALFESEFNVTGWSEPKLLPFIDSAYQYTHPGLSGDGNTLVFASNRPGGFGGFDIWISYKNGNLWSDPINAGANVNSKSNETFPSLVGRNIYFSSDRKGKGGLDIYAYDTLRKMSKTLDAPINSIFDDFGFISNDGERNGYFSSNREGTDQIWKFNQEIEEVKECDTIITNLLCYSLAEENAESFGDSDGLVYQWSINEDKRYGSAIDYCFPGEGGYEISLDVIDTIINETFFNQSYYYLEIMFEVQPYITSPDTVLVGEKFNLSSKETNLPDAEISSYDWFISDGLVAKGENIEHSFDAPGEYRVEMTANGISADTAFYDCVYKVIKCFEKKVLSDNIDNQNALEDSSMIKKEDHSFVEENDSTDMAYAIEVIRTKEQLPKNNFLFQLMETYGDVKIHYIEESQEYSYLIGEWKNLDEAHPTWKELIDNGYEDAVVRSIDLNKISNFSLDASFELDNVRFDEGSWVVRKDAYPDLENVLEIMLVFPEIKLKIEAHTNSRGEAASNLELSIKRAESVKGYFVSNGVAPERITAVGFGETKPKESNDTEHGLEVNRRVEFMFIKN